MRNENTKSRASTLFLIWLTALLAMAALLITGGTVAENGEKAVDKKSEQSEDGKRLVIRSKSGGKVVISKAELSRRPGRAGADAIASRRPTPSAMDPVPTVLKLTFPTLVYPGEEVKGALKFNDPDDYVFSIFITVFFPDGDVVTESLYDYRIDGGDIYKGNYKFWVEFPESETPLTGKIVITCSDEYLNVSEVTQNFALWY